MGKVVSEGMKDKFRKARLQIIIIAGFLLAVSLFATYALIISKEPAWVILIALGMYLQFQVLLLFLETLG